jgi:hypothetical protein
MAERALRVLYLDTYTVADPRAGTPSSDAIGYGVTASGAIQRELQALGFEVIRPDLEGAAQPSSPRQARLQWLVDGYAAILAALQGGPPDLIFSFHIFAAFNADVAAQIDAKAAVVGLPIDTPTIDRCKTTESFPRLTVVFNHAPVSSKNPELFARVMETVMARYPVNVLFTRRFDASSPGFDAVAGLADRFGERVLLGNDMRLGDY